MQHVNRLRDLCQQSPSLLGRSGLGGHFLGGHFLGGHGVLRRQPRRQHEHHLRIDVAAFRLWACQRGWTLEQTAELLQLSPRTLRQWQHDLGCARLHLEALGRPRLRSSRTDRQELLEVLHELGPATGLPTLQDAFPHMPRAELDDLLRRYRRVWRQRYHQLLRVLHWHVPGAVWAMDFAEPDRRLLSVPAGGARPRQRPAAGMAPLAECRRAAGDPRPRTALHPLWRAAGPEKR